MSYSPKSCKHILEAHILVAALHAFYITAVRQGGFEANLQVPWGSSRVFKSRIETVSRHNPSPSHPSLHTHSTTFPHSSCS